MRASRHCLDELEAELRDLPIWEGDYTAFREEGLHGARRLGSGFLESRQRL